MTTAAAEPRARLLFVGDGEDEDQAEEFFLEPEWDQMVAEFGLPDLMLEVDWAFHWPTDPPKPPVKRRAQRTGTTRTRTTRNRKTS